MSKTPHTFLLGVSGCLAVLLLGNLLVHVLFYILDGNMGNFLSPIWMSMNGIMVFFCLVFGWTLKRERGLSH